MRTAEGNRQLRKLRWKLLAFSLPLVVLAMVLVVKLLGLSTVASVAIAAYNLGDYVSSGEVSSSQLQDNYFEPWIPWFNRGAASAAGGDYIGAIEDFERALPLVPDDRKCEVVLNLSLSWERLADQYVSAGYPSGAVLLYQAALDVLTTEGPHCSVPEATEELQQQQDEAIDRLEQRIEQSQALSDGTDPDAMTGQERLDELERRGDDSLRQKTEDDDNRRSEEQGSPGTDRPW